jgi:ribosomal protein S18 acetylase RimI-like enzyme
MPRHSGKGIGADLLRAALSWARQEGARAVVLNVRDGADVARRLYQSHGFVDTGTRLEILRNGD